MRDVVGAADPTYRARALTRLRGLLLDNEVLRPRGMSLRLALHPLPNRVALFRGGVDDFLRALADQGESSPQELIYRGSIAYAVGGPIAVPWQGCYMILGAPERIGALLDSMGC